MKIIVALLAVAVVVGIIDSIRYSKFRRRFLLLDGSTLMSYTVACSNPECHNGFIKTRIDEGLVEFCDRCDGTGREVIRNARRRSVPLRIL